MDGWGDDFNVIWKEEEIAEKSRELFQFQSSNVAYVT
jgi:hypothetical protein